MLVNGFHLPSGDTFHLQIATLGEQADMEILRIIVMPANRGLPVVGKDLDQMFVDEDAQGEVFPVLQLEWRLDVADIQVLAALAG